MNRVSDPDWKSLENKIIVWDERLRTREREIQALDVRLRELEERLGALKRRLAQGTGRIAVPPVPQPDPGSAPS
jgi:predicted  nucleic acid-binding Zn-ribbon protein